MLARIFGLFHVNTKQAVLRFIIVSGIALLVVAIFASDQQKVYNTKDILLLTPEENVLRVPVAGVQSSSNVTIASSSKGITSSENESKLKDTHVVQLKHHWDQSKLSSNGALLAQQRLLEGLIPSNVHYMWCGKGWFEFREYLSVMSVLRAMDPDRIVLHYEYEPSVDKLFYHQWLDFLKQDYPFLVLERMDDNLVRFCEADRETQISLILELLNKEGGMYISHRTWLLTYPVLNRKADFEMALDLDSVDGYMLMRAGMYSTPGISYKDLLANSNLKAHHSQCGRIHHVYHGHTQDGCLVVSGGGFDHFFPMDIWELDDPFGRVARHIFYGTEKIRKPVPSYDELVPNIGHMVWIGGGEMDFVFYLSLLSMLYVVKVDVIYIHGDKPPTGPYWATLEANARVRDRIKLITLTPPTHIFQGVIEPWYVALMSDLIRVDLMIKYGGVYTDTDAIWVKGLSQEDRGYDAVASFDWVDWSWPYPDSVNFGLSYGKRNAPFWQLFRDTMRTLHNDVHGFTGVMNPYKILERYPHLLRIDRHLQVICYESRCHPIWVNDYHNMSRDHVTDHSLDNWRNDVNALHWTYPNPKELQDEATLRNSSGLFADVGKFVLQQAGLW